MTNAMGDGTQREKGRYERSKGKHIDHARGNSASVPTLNLFIFILTFGSI